MKHILIVDDSRDLLSMLSMFLEGAGFSTKEAASGSEAMKVLSENQIDLVISDLEMPDGDGFWLLEKSKLLGNPPKVIITSGSLNVKEADLLALGAHAFFRKPFSIGQFLEYITCIKENT